MNLFKNNRSIKGFAKWSWARFFSSTHLIDPYLRIRHSLCGPCQVVILAYHRVITSDKRDRVFSLPEIVVRQETFEKQMRFLAQNYNILSLNKYLELRSKKQTLPPKTAIITFDDGWEDHYLYAFPILKKYTLPATIFLTTEFIGKSKVFWQVRVLFFLKKLLSSPSGLKKVLNGPYPESIKQLFQNIIHGENGKNLALTIIEHFKLMSEDKRNSLVNTLQSNVDNSEFPFEQNSFLTWEQIKEMQEYQISFGSHGTNHRILTRLKEKELIDELVTSRKLIESQLREPIKVFAYPNGNYNGRIIKALINEGYESAVTVDPGFNRFKTDLYRLKRININEGSTSNLKGNFCEKLFAARLAGVL